MIPSPVSSAWAGRDAPQRRRPGGRIQPRLGLPGRLLAGLQELSLNQYEGACRISSVSLTVSHLPLSSLSCRMISQPSLLAVAARSAEPSAKLLQTVWKRLAVQLASRFPCLASGTMIRCTHLKFVVYCSINYFCEMNYNSMFTKFTF